MSALGGLKWLVMDLLPDAIQLVKLGVEAAREKRLDRKAEREAIRRGFVVTQKAKRREN